MSAKDPRKAFEETLVELGKENNKIVAVSCDSSSGGGLGTFFKTYPERSVETGISEQNAIGICAGLAKQGFIPVIVVITPFITMRAYEQVRDDIGYMKMNVKLVGSGGGLAYSTLGSTHEAIEDISLMRTIPNLTVLAPGDAFEVEQALKLAIEHEGPVYIRMPRQARPYAAESEKRKITLGKAEVLKDGKDVAILTYGPMVEESQKAAAILQQGGIDAAVLNFTTVKPLDEDIIKKYMGKVKMLVTVEEHSVVNGFGSAVAQFKAPLKNASPVYIMGIPEGSKMTGPYPEVIDYYGLSGEKIAGNIKNLYRETGK
jgi:transketolase